MERGCLGFAIASLSSRDAQVRQAGYHVLSRYMTHLEGARFKERKQVSEVGYSNVQGKVSQSVSQSDG